MARWLFAAGFAPVLAVALAACQPSAKINAEDPFSTLHPWNPEWSQVVKLDSGVQYIVIRKGDGKGPNPSPADRVEVHYDGRFATDGEQFDTSYGDEPASFRLNQVIPGWTEGLQNMRPGDEFMFWIPSAMGYGENGSPGGIPPNADLMFRVELLGVTPAVAATPEAWAKVTPWPTDSSDVVRTGSGLEYLIVESGRTDEAPPTDRDFAIVHFEGRLDDGGVVDSTFETQEERNFPIAQLVPGWAEALKMMHPGDRWMVRIPPHLMYGAEGDGRIPPNANLTFEVVLQDVIRIDPPPAEPPQ